MRSLVLAIAVLAACGDDGGGAPIPITELEQTTITAYCNKYVTCGLVDDLATCRTLNLGLNVEPSIVAAVQAGKIVYHPDKARECLDALTGTCDRTAFINGRTPLACAEIFIGVVAGGGACALDEECISLECNVAGCQGTCVGSTPPEARPRVGEACGTGPDCIDSFCDYVATMTCKPYLTNGSACTSSEQCASSSCVDTVCSAVPKTGEACAAPAAPFRCREVGDTCSAATTTCVRFGLSGDPCTAALDCAPLYTCGTDSTCHLRARLGEACDGQNIASCIDYSWCDSTTQSCTALKADGEPCTADEECTSGACDSGTGQCMTQQICI